jgi:hypothetical protein
MDEALKAKLNEARKRMTSQQDGIFQLAVNAADAEKNKKARLSRVS